jgi:hypothetical protein
MSKKEAPRDYTYFHERLDPLGWTPDHGRVLLPASVAGDGKDHVQKLFDVDEEGNLVINYYRHNGAQAHYRRNDGPVRHYQVLRLRAPKVRPDGGLEKYKHPSGTGTLPWFCPGLINAYNAGQEVETVVLVEGVLKAYAAGVQGLMAVGLPGIHNVKDKQTGTLHADLITLLRALKPRQVVFLHDGDCRRLTSDWPERADADLYKRPNSFFTSARNMGVLLKDEARVVGFHPYYMHVVSESVPVGPKTEAPKGLDDLLLAYADAKVLEAAHRVTKDAEPVLPTPARQRELRKLAMQEVVADLHNFSKPCQFFERKDLDRPDKLRDYFHLRSADTFYNAYQEQLGDSEFVYDGTKYQWDESEKQLKVKVPSVAKKYVRVGVDYFKYIKIRNPYSKQLEERLQKWAKGAIVDDHGKHFCDHILKLDSFVNYPDHVAYQEILDNCLNSYSRFMHSPEHDGEQPTVTLGFLEHIFGNGVVEVEHPKNVGQMIRVKELDLGLDYLKLLLEQPTQMLPILCLISKERGTGKTTFFNFLKHLFGHNCTQIGAKDLENDFNYHYASKLIAIIDEALVSKQESVEKLKHLSTAQQIMVNNKGVAQYEQACFLKFLLGSNNIRNFIRTDDDEVRFWVRKVPRIPANMLDTELETKMVDEIPCFLGYLLKRPMGTQKLFRSWFHPPLLVTDALQDIRKHSAPTAKREIQGWIAGMFHAMPDCHTILMTADDIVKEVFPGKRMDRKYITEVLREDMEVHKYGMVQKGKSITTPYSYWRIAEVADGDNRKAIIQEVKRPVPGRPFEFNRRAFVTEEQDDATSRELVAPAQRTKTETANAALASVGGDDDLPF